jgi:hypothetical protein
MSDQDIIECDTHGTSTATYICKHLVQGENLGFNIGFDPENPFDLYPDAWCDECDKILDEEGEWNERSESFADIKIVCTQCYMNARERNWIEDSEAFFDYITECFQYLQGKHKLMIETYQIDKFDRWDWHQETGKLLFSHEGKLRVEADISFSGSISTKSNTWMWAWANESLTETIKAKSEIIHEIGINSGFKKLLCGIWPADEIDGWEMTAVLAKELQAIGAYRTSDDHGFTYMVITGIRNVN